MITAVAMNPCVDRSVTVDRFAYGKTNLVLSAREDASGKGVNVALVLRQLGEPVRCVAPLYAAGGEKLQSRLEAEGIPFSFVKAAGRLRCNIKVLDLADQTLTELNERGTKLDKITTDALYNKILEAAADSRMLVLSGSLPQGVPQDFYLQILRGVKGRVKTVLDTSGAALEEGLKGLPDVIKPNLEEFSQLHGRTYRTPEEIAHDALAMNAAGIETVCVSMGDKGAVMALRGSAFFAPPLALPVRGVQGAGDSMVAGVCFALERGMNAADTLRSGVAAACGSLVRDGTLLCEGEAYHRYFKKITVSPILP